MSNAKPIKHTVYFAAANGYSGFRSYFGEVFKSEDFERIYVLKGGPGTGKSTLMKNVRSHFQNIADTESVLCSSDMNSLDGIIVERMGKKCAVLDGTSPHERDAVIPGAIDDIVNLGEGWKSSTLIKRRSEILEINKRKKDYYSCAYKMLMMAGEADKEAERIISSALNERKLKDITESILKDMPSQERSEGIKIKLSSCFGKSCEKWIPSDDINTVYLNGAYGCAHFVMEEIKRACLSEKIISEISPSVFTDERINSISFSSIRYRTEKSIGAIDCSEILDPISEHRAVYLNELLDTKQGLLCASSKYFELASKEHFKLEDIYARAMDFNKGEERCKEIIKDFSRALNI